MPLNLDYKVSEEELIALSSRPTEVMVRSGYMEAMRMADVDDPSKEELAAQAAFADSFLTGSDFNIGFEQKRRSSVDDIRRTTEENAAAQFKVNARDSFYENAAKGDMEAAEKDLLDVVNAVNPKYGEIISSAFAEEEAPIEQITDVAQAIDGRWTLQGAMQSAYDQWGFWDWVGDFAHDIFLPGHDARVLRDVVSNVMGEEAKSGFLFKDYADIAELRARLNRMSDEQKEEVVKAIEAVAKSETGLVWDNPKEVSDLFATFLYSDSLDSTIENAFTGIDVAGFISILKPLRALQVKTGNAAVASALGNKELAARAVASDVVNGTKMSGIDLSADLVKYATTTGQNPHLLVPKIMDGMKEETKQALADYAASREIAELAALTGHTGIDERTVRDIAEKWRAHYEKASIPHVREAVEATTDDLGSRWVLDIVDPNTSANFATKEAAERFAKTLDLESYNIVGKIEGPWETFSIKGVVHHANTLDDVGSFAYEKSLLTRILPQWLQFPMQSLDSSAVLTRVIGVKKEDMVRQNFEKLWKKAFKGLKADSENKVIALLAEGDSISRAGKQGHVFTWAELEAKGITEAEKAAYYNVRTMRDIAFTMHDKALTDRLNFLGYSNFNYHKGSKIMPPFVMAGKEYSEAEAKGLMRTQARRHAYDLERGQMVELNESIIDNLYKIDGKRLIHLSQGKETAEGATDLVIASADNYSISKLTSTLSYREGEFSRIYQDKWFVAAEKDGYRSGVRGKYAATIRSAPTHKSAEEWVNAHNSALQIMKDVTEEFTKAGKATLTKKGLPTKAYQTALLRAISQADVISKWKPKEFVEDVLSGRLPMDTKLHVKFDREIPAGESVDHIMEVMHTQGRLFTGQKGAALKSVAGDEAPTMGLKEAFASEVGYLARFTNIATWRESQIQKLLNTFKGRLQGHPGATPYETAMMGDRIGSWTIDEQKWLERMRHHIQTQLGVRSDEAVTSAARMKEFGLWLEGKGYDKAAQVSYNLGHRSPAQALRGAVFHSYLGLFNIAQFFVQANGAAVAMTAHPIHGLKAALEYAPLRIGIMFDTLGNKAALESLASKIDFASLGLKNKQEFLDTVRLVRESGLLNDIKSSALYYVKEGAINLESDMAAFTSGFARAASRAGNATLQAGLVPFNRGEEMSRLIAMGVAKRMWKEANPGKNMLDRQAVNEILALTEKYTIGMSRANVGRMQQGWLSIPFQFAQYNWKLAESLLGRGTFTPAEKARILTGMTALYGADGMGLGFMFDEIYGSADIDKNTKIGIMQGAISWALAEAYGVDTAIGHRVGPIGYFSDLKDAFLDPKNAPIELFGGASLSAAGKEWDVITGVMEMYRSTDDWTAEHTLATGNLVLGGISSGWKNSTKYLTAMWGDGMLKSRYGDALAQIDTKQALLGAMGITPLQEWEISQMFNISREMKEEKEDLVKSMTAALNGMSSAKSDAEYKRYQDQYRYLWNTLPTQIALEVDKQARSRATRMESMFEFMERKQQREFDKRKVD